MLRPAALDGGAKVRLEVRSAAHDHVRADGVDVGVHQLGLPRSEHCSAEAGAERPEARAVHHPSHAVDVLRRVRSEIEPRVAHPPADEPGLDHPLALRVRHVEQHRSAVVEEAERHPAGAGRLEHEAVPPARVVGSEAVGVAKHLVALDDSEASELVGTADLPRVDSFAPGTARGRRARGRRRGPPSRGHGGRAARGAPHAARRAPCADRARRGRSSPFRPRVSGSRRRAASSHPKSRRHGPSPYHPIRPILRSPPSRRRALRRGSPRARRRRSGASPPPPARPRAVCRRARRPRGRASTARYRSPRGRRPRRRSEPSCRGTRRRRVARRSSATTRCARSATRRNSGRRARAGRGPPRPAA